MPRPTLLRVSVSLSSSKSHLNPVNRFLGSSDPGQPLFDLPTTHRRTRSIATGDQVCETFRVQSRLPRTSSPLRDPFRPDERGWFKVESVQVDGGTDLCPPTGTTGDVLCYFSFSKHPSQKKCNTRLLQPNLSRKIGSLTGYPPTKF